MGLMDKINGKLQKLGLQNDRSYENGDAAKFALTKAKLKFFQKPGKNAPANVKGETDIEFFLNQRLCAYRDCAQAYNQGGEENAAHENIS